jgi:extradiol dioxygenase family protein
MRMLVLSHKRLGVGIPMKDWNNFSKRDDVKRMKQVEKARLRHVGEMKELMDKAIPLTVKMLTTFPKKKEQTQC